MGLSENTNFRVHISYCPLYWPSIFVRPSLKGNNPHYLSAEVLKPLEKCKGYLATVALATLDQSHLSPRTGRVGIWWGHASRILKAQKSVSLDSLCGSYQSRTKNRLSWPVLPAESLFWKLMFLSNNTCHDQVPSKRGHFMLGKQSPWWNCLALWSLPDSKNGAQDPRVVT